MKPKINPEETEWKCPVCGWQGTVEEMTSDFVTNDEDESYSNFICPGCYSWNAYGNESENLLDSDWIAVTE